MTHAETSTGTLQIIRLGTNKLPFHVSWKGGLFVSQAKSLGFSSPALTHNRRNGPGSHAKSSTYFFEHCLAMSGTLPPGIDKIRRGVIIFVANPTKYGLNIS